MKKISFFLGLATTFLCLSGSAYANLTINPIFDSSITNDPNASTIESTINSALASYSQNFSNNLSFSITFKSVSTGLGQSNTSYTDAAYSDFYNALAGSASTPLDATVLAHLPNGSASNSTDPVVGNSNITLTLANAAVLGLYSLSSGDSVSTISLNTGLMNLSRTGPQVDGKYDLESTVWHEVDEVLGTASGLGNSGPAEITPIDLFRFDQNGDRSFTIGTGVQAYLSFDGGTTKLVQYNQDGVGDYGDFAQGVTPTHVQDAYATPYGSPGAQPDLGVELQMIDAIGYAAVPEPSTTALLSFAGLIGLLAFRQRRKASAQNR